MFLCTSAEEGKFFCPVNLSLKGVHMSICDITTNSDPIESVVTFKINHI